MKESDCGSSVTFFSALRRVRINGPGKREGRELAGKQTIFSGGLEVCPKDGHKTVPFYL